jgi:hypothetical protein
LAQWVQVTLHQSIDNHETADVMAAAASGGQSEQIGMKRGRHRPFGHATLFE